FHARHYHPSNAVFATYGDIPAAEHQAIFEDRVLRHFQAQPLDFRIPDERRYGAPLKVEERYPLVGETDLRDKTHIVLGWLLGPLTDPLETLRARILDGVLLDNSSSPLRHALETTELGSAPSPLCGYNDDTRETTFACGLEGSNPEHADAVEALILGVLGKVADAGVPAEQVEAVLHQLELAQREITGDGFPYGLKLLFDALTPAIHGGDPLSGLDLDPLLNQLRAEIRDPGFIPGLVRRLLLDNPHRVRLVLAPDAELATRLEAAERERLACIAAGLGEAEREAIGERARALEERQARQDDPEILPRVTLEDVPPELHIVEGERREIGGLPAMVYAQGTNGMVYEQIVIDLPPLDETLLDLLPLYTLCLTEVGSGGRDYLATQARQAAVTGGLSARALVRGHIADVQRVQGVLALSGKALVRNQGPLAELLVDTLATARFDELERLRELVAQTRAQREESVADHGHALAMIAASAPLSPAAALEQRWGGLDGLKRLRTLDDTLDERGVLEDFAARLARLHALVQSAPRQLLVVAEEEQHAVIAAALAGQLARLPAAATGAGFALPAVSGRVRQGWSINAQVNFCARAYPTVPPGHADAPALQVLGEFLRNGHLHRAIREQGGAYGAGASYHGDSGTFRFFSYRDPRLTETLSDFDRALEWLLGSTHPARTLEEAILGVIGAIDRPASPAGEAISSFFGSLFGRTPEFRREFRRRVLAVTLDDLQRVAATYLTPERVSTAVLGGAERLKGLEGFEVVGL
ncbi:MAG TPA: insulinase family protein, partial [Candidatus Competibacteraceae bacterium]|nr:insulinase family protein [Candidatus Competibacteraceae bacterium]